MRIYCGYTVRQFLKFFYYNSVKRGLFATKFCLHSATNNVKKCCKLGYSTISTLSCAHILRLKRTSFLKFFYYNFVKGGPFATKFCTHSATDNMNKCCKFCYFEISTFFICACIVAKPYVGTYGLVTIYAHTRK